METTANNYRYERKFFISDCSYQEVESMVRLHPAMFSEIFHRRLVNNIYFDTLELQNFVDNIDGSAERLKVRIRWYGEIYDKIEKPVLELKFKKGLVGRKESYPLTPFELDPDFTVGTVFRIVAQSDIPEKIKIQFHSLNPIVLNQYSRKYFQSADKHYRITLDSDQYFCGIGRENNSFLNHFTDADNVILELKYDINMDDDADRITKFFPLRLTRSSKYVTGIKTVYS